MPFDLGLFKRQRYIQPSITSFGGNFITVHSSTSTDYAVHVFKSSGAFTFPAYLTTATANVFVVGGGGGGNAGGGNSQGGGGGAGGVLSSSTYSLSPGSTYAVAVGSGGAIGGSGNYSAVRSPADTTYSTALSAQAYLTTPTNSAFDITGGDFTVEFWINFTAYNTMGSSGMTIVSNFLSSNGWLCGFSGISSLTNAFFNTYSGTAGAGSMSAAGINSITLPLNTWHHMAYVRNGTNFYIFMDGVSYALTGTYAASGGPGQQLAIGVYQQNMGYSGNPNCKISNLRIIKGTALYTSNFAPPTRALTALSSPSLYANYFSGGPALSIPSSAVSFGASADFTIETWVNWPSAAGGNQTYIELVGAARLIIGRTTSGFRLFNDGTAKDFTYTFNPGVWYHIAMVRVSGTNSVYINGVLANTPYANSTNWSFTTITIGRNSDGAETMTGYVSNLRIVKGLALYTGTFTPPQATLTTTQVAGTNIAAISTASYVGLLTAQSATIVDNSTYAQAITLIGVPTVISTATLYSTSLLTLQDATFKDNSGNNLTITPTGSVTITSTIVPPFGQFAYGGGSGAPGSVSNQVGYSGASGGGSSVWNFNGTILGGGNIPGQGNAGGGATGAGSNFASGGGGGAGSAGGQGNAGTNIGGAGGTGTFTTFFSTTIAITAQIGQYITATNAVYFAGGGGGGGNGTTNVGGWGGGGAAGWSAAAITGITNSGGGGGSAAGTAAAGGSGVVVITYPLPATVSAVDTTPTDPYFKNTSLLLSNPAAAASIIPVDYLVVAGGGGGGYFNGGAGGGAGGLLTGTTSSIIANTLYTVTIGTGGAGATSTGVYGGNGGASIFASISTVGGGGAGSGDGAAYIGRVGGSGGGGASTGGTSGAGGAGTPGQGNAGGAGITDSAYRNGGGGGGAGVAGSAAINASGGAGGTGTFTTLISTTTAIALGIGQYVTATNAIYFAGGGGGAGYTGRTGGAGGAGGGGVGVNTGAAGNGLPNSGGGGGGIVNAGGATAGGSGGSGVVLLRVSDSYAAYFSSGVTAYATTATGYNIYAVTSGTGTVLFAPAPAVTFVPIDYLVVAGGGGGGANDAAGGGAGGLLTSTGYTLLTGFSYAIIVGAGGAGGVNNAQGTNGNNSRLNEALSYGGGGGGSDSNGSATRSDTGKSGGSGGGGGGGTALTTPSLGGGGVAGQGNSGGAGGPNQGSGVGGGGGGGAGTAGTATVSGGGGDGGIGLPSSITGSAVYYAGGGGGGSRTTPGTGGTGGGGAGSFGGITASGTANTGGGGGGSGNDSEGSWTGTGGSGGSGVVIVRHLISVSQTITTTGSPTITTTGSYKVYTFTSSGSIQVGSAPIAVAVANTNSSFVDSSANALTITPAGTPTQGSFTPFGDSWSTYFNGSSYLRKVGSGVLATAGGDLTIETWIYTSNSSIVGLYDGGPGQVACIRNITANIFGYQTNDGAGANITGLFPLNAWFHLAITYSGSSVKAYVNGSLVATGSAGAYIVGSNFDIGSINSGSGGYFTGYLSNYRVTNRLVYTANFTPATLPLPVVTNTSLLTAASNRFMNKSSSTSTFTVSGTPSVSRFSPFVAQSYAYNTIVQGGSAYFNGSSYLTVPASTLFTLNADFTIDFWANMNSFAVSGGGSPGILSGTNSANNWLVIFDASACYFYWNGAAVLTATVANATGEWMHWAISRSGSTLRIFKNGNIVGTTTNASSYTLNNSVLYVGAANTTVGFLNGYISNLRIIKNIALYTSSFTTPNTPTLDSYLATYADPYWNSVNFLINADSGSLVDRRGTYTLTPIGTAAVNTSIKKFGAGSVAVLGGGNTASLQLVAGDITIPAAFTLDGWLYLTASGSHSILGSPSGSAYSTTYGFGIFNNKGLTFSLSPINGYSGNMLYSGQYPTLNTWTHFAIQRDAAGAWSIYMNGVKGTLQNDNAVVHSFSQFPASNGPTGSLNVYGLVGNWNGFVTGGNSVSYPAGFNGYLDDFRLTLGVARYSGNTFVPPTIDAYTLAQTPNTSLLLNNTNAAIYDATMNNDVIIVGAATLSTTVTKFNKGSIYINGTSNYISGPSNPLLAFGTGDFTVEMWLYLNVAPASGVELYITGNFHLNFRSATTIAITNDASVLSNLSNAISAGVWTHIAAVRQSGTMTIYLNGIGNTPATGQTFSFTQSGWNTGTGGSGFNGYIDDLRITNGVARYTANFIPPTTVPKLK